MLARVLRRRALVQNRHQPWNSNLESALESRTHEFWWAWRAPLHRISSDPMVNTCMMKFCEYLADQDPPSALDPDCLLADSGLLENLVLTESFSATAVKTVAVGILLKLSQLRQQILHDRTAGTADKALSNMIFFLASMLGVAIGGMRSDAALVDKARSAAAR